MANAALSWFRTFFKSLPQQRKGSARRARRERGGQVSAEQGLQDHLPQFQVWRGRDRHHRPRREDACFVEVKTRTYDEPTPEDQVNPNKRHQLTKAARLLSLAATEPQPPARFDVVAIVWPKGVPR